MSTQKKLVPQIDMLTISGETISTKDLKGSVYLVNFWATDCPGCIEEMPGLIDTFNKYKNKNFTVIAVSMFYDPPSRVLSYTEKNKLPFPVTLDLDKNIMNSFDDIKLTPTSVLINKKGQVVNTIIGVLDFKDLHEKIDLMLKN
ncbi:MAG: peroxiredoxin family protein [Methylophilaceae bacterium]|jgi:peroxiredoxin|tara:strand:+ start:1192 stop:1623 length:432 start_codon:yes stop_codon:yes gene_type:complete